MDPCIIAWDLGTGGCKASVYTAAGECLAAFFVPYETSYPAPGWHEQRPLGWWQAVVAGTRQLLSSTSIDRRAIYCCGISGHSLGVVPLDRHGQLLRETTPIWSDARAARQAEDFFARFDQKAWYLTTGNGFPPPLYSAFKMMWYRQHEPAMFHQIATVIGTKDYINYRLTGQLVTDPSYASGSGVYDLEAGAYSPALIDASGLSPDIFPPIVPSTQVIGELTAAAAEALGLPRSVRVVAGGVDNACMALGARNFVPGRVYNSLGSSSWIAVSSAQPLLERHVRPFVFAHVIPGMFTSAVSIFSAGSSFRWVRDQLCPDLVAQARQQGADPYDLMTALAAASPPGANRLLFNPSLAGGNALDRSPQVRGAYIGLDLRHTRADLIRAAMEGIALGLERALGVLRDLACLEDTMLVVGGCSKSALWRQIFADVYDMDIVQTNVDQGAAALGAMALAAVGSGLWPDFSRLDQIHQVVSITHPIPENRAQYARLIPIYRQAADYHAELGDLLAS